MMQATLKFWQNGKPVRYCFADGVKVTPIPKHNASASGYGGKIPTEYTVKYKGRWWRVYAACYSNCETLYIGPQEKPWLAVIEIESL